MKTPLRLLPIALLALWACSRDRDLPPPYRSLAVPEARLASAPARQRGRALFLEHCALCHGEHADGRGIRRNLSSRPVSFTDLEWRRRATPRLVYHLLREGKQGTAMPAWKVLDEDQTWDLVAYVLSVAGEPPGG